MKKLRLYPALLVSWGFMTAVAYAQCHDVSPNVGDSRHGTLQSVSPTTKTAGEEDRTVLLTLALRKSGAVREAKVLKGPTALREPAIQAAKHRKYKDALNAWPFSNEIMVEVTFPKGKNRASEIRQALPAGVLGCVYVTRVRVSSEVMESYLLERVDPIYPAGVERAGPLILRLHIEEDGNVSSVEKVSGPDALAPAAIDAVKKWKYRTYELNGAAIAVETTVEVKPPA
jgi:Gram-negative bacterial TonB protein C-terminal